MIILWVVITISNFISMIMIFRSINKLVNAINKVTSVAVKTRMDVDTIAALMDNRPSRFPFEERQ